MIAELFRANRKKPLPLQKRFFDISVRYLSFVAAASGKASCKEQVLQPTLGFSSESVSIKVSAFSPLRLENATLIISFMRLI